eukprot:TRINITY_DN23581_c0_g1_i2.p1 TRINITY_DN23581_c0_g1~~TRINITY_DN23581_c0_g1_i2.p1  ORF type:complete len:204 (+),score=27.56 TRINITY_DN23581_c0_g1_i2:221-832(+)
MSGSQHVTKKLEVKNTFADDEVHHAIKTLIAETVDLMTNADLWDAYRHPGSPGLMEVRVSLRNRLGRELTKNEDMAVDHYVRTRYEKHQPPRAAMRSAVRRITPSVSVLLELGDDRPAGTGVPQPQWDHDTSNCGRCEKEFGVVFSKRHHCRGCGINVCDGCSPHTAVFEEQMGYGSAPQRICKICHEARKARNIDRMINFGN